MPKIFSQNSTSATHLKPLIYFPVILVFFFLLVTGLYIDRVNSQAHMQGLKHDLISKASAIRAQLEGNINSNAMVVKGLVIAISLEPEMTQQRFVDLSTPLLTGHSQINNIAAAPNLVIRYMNPVAGNEAAIGIDYNLVPDQIESVNLVRRTGKLILAGPVDLVQGGQGFIARIPVYTTSVTNGDKKFWGIVSSVINVDKFFKGSGLYDEELDIEVAIRNQNIPGTQGTVIFGDPNIFTSDPVLSEIALPYGTWLLAAIPKGGWVNFNRSLIPFRTGLIVISLLILTPIYVLSLSLAKKRQSETRLRLLFKQSPVGIALNNFDTGEFIEVNDTFVKSTGYTAEEIKSLSYWDITPEKYKKQEAIQLDKLKKTGKYGPYEKEYRHKDGSLYPVLLNGIKINDSMGNALIWSFIEDISKRKLTEKTLQRSQKMDAVGQLTGGIAHDFNNILGVMLGNVELLSDNLTQQSDKTKKRIKSIQKAGLRATDLTRQLLSFARDKSSQQDYFSLNKLIEGMENLISRSITPEIEVSHELEECLWLTKINSGEFEDALLNLCINARDAIKEHGKLIITTRNVTINKSSSDVNGYVATGDYVELAISDSGEGISTELQERIFEPFYTTKDEGKGTGLGLAMVYGFVQRSGGFINIDSEPGAGSTFKLYLPRADGNEKRSKDSSNKIEILPEGAESILVVDDEPVLLEFACEVLESRGYRIFTAKNGIEALRVLEKHPDINLLFSDVVMPNGMNGYELAEQAKAKYKNLKVLLTSGYTGKAYHKHGSNKSYDDSNILQKPYSQSELLNSMRTTLDHQK